MPHQPDTADLARRVMERKQAFEATANDPWVEHNGMGRPHPPKTFVEVEHRDGSIRSGVSAFVYWPHDGSATDIIRYRIRPAPNDGLSAEESEALAQAALEKDAEIERRDAVIRELRSKLLAFVGATAEYTNCSADVEAIKRADVILGDAKL